MLQGLHQLPPPGPDLLVEHEMIPDLPDGRSGLENAVLRAAGIPVLGKIDLIHARASNYGVQDILESIDEEGVLKIADHKFPNSMRNAKSGKDLLTELQTVGYGLWAFKTFPDLERVRLSHNYFPVQGSPRAPSVLATREQLEPRWKHADAIGVSMRDAAREPDIDKVDANTRACRAYGRDCPAKSVCKAASFNSLASLVGVSAASKFIGDRVHLPVIPPTSQAQQATPTQSYASQNTGAALDMTAPMSPNSLMARLAAQGQAQQPAPAPAPVTAPAAPAVSPAVAAEMERLAAQEIAAASGAPVPPAAPAPASAPAPAPAAPALTLALPTVPVSVPPRATPEQMAMIGELAACGLGLPTFAAQAAEALANAQGIAFTPGAEFPGQGELAIHKITSLDILPAVLSEAKTIAAKRAADAAQAAQAPAPAPTPAPAAAPAPSILPPDAAAPLAPPAVTRSELPQAPAAAPVVVPMPEPSAQAPTTAPTSPAPSEEPATKTKKKSGKKAESESTPAAQATSPAPAPTSPTAATSAAGPINLFVDCQVDGIPTQSLWPLVDKIHAWMNEEARKQDGLPEGAPYDFRYSNPEGKFGYVRWKGVVAACLHATPPAGGNWTIDTRSDLGAAVVDSMREIVRASGGVMVRGARS